MLRSAALVVTAASFLAGCPSEADRRAQAGLDALARCEMREAHLAFRHARELEPARSDIALAYALTDLAILAEDPAVVALAQKLGFDREIDTALLWGEDGLLDRLGRDEDCAAIEAWNEQTFPHPSVRADGPSFWSTTAPSLTVGDVRDALVALSPRLERISDALQVAAADLDEGASIEAGCGIGTDRPMHVQRAEILVLATALESVVAATAALDGYDGSIPLRMLVQGALGGEEDEWVAAMNAGFFRPTDPEAIEASRERFVTAAQLARQAVAAVRDARAAGAVEDAIFDWTQLPVSVIDDVDAFATAIESGLDGDDMVTIPRLSPDLGIDLASFFTEPFDGTASGPVWEVYEDEETGDRWVSSSNVVLEAMLAERFDSNPWGVGAPDRDFSVDWSSVEWASVFDPAERWSASYACE